MAWDLFPAPGIVKQLTGSKLGGSNCGAATAAMALLSERQGKRPSKGSPWPPTSDSFRAATGDTVGGLLASTIDETSNRVYGIDPDFQIAPESLVIAKLRAGYGIHTLRSEGPILDAGFEGSPGFRGNHSSFGSGYRESSPALRDCNPLYDGRHPRTPRGPQWVPWEAYVRASELLVIGEHGERVIDRYGPRMLYVGFTRVPYRPTAPVKTVRYSVAFSGAEFYTYTLVNGVIAPARSVAAFSGPTSAGCGAPAVYPWPGHTPRRLVRMTAGRLKGVYVAVDQGGAKLVTKEVAA